MNFGNTASTLNKHYS